MTDFVYSGGVRFDDEAVADVTMDKDGHPLTCKNPITGEELGGGGSSDFSTAEVTIVDLSTTDPNRYGELEYPFTLGIIGAIEEGLTSQMVFNSASDVKNAVLYNNQQRIYNMGVVEGIVSVSGNAELVDNATDPRKTDLVITGNCTLSIGFRK